MTLLRTHERHQRMARFTAETTAVQLWLDQSPRIGAPSLEDYRRAYAGCGAPWPGDDEIRRRHPVAADPAA